MEKHFSEVAALIGDRARSVMLWNMLDGRAYTATELAICADVSPQSASNHLNKLVMADILAVTKQGRHRYYVFNSHEAAHVIESMASLFPKEKKIIRPRPERLTIARTCYDHLAGSLGVGITEALQKKKIILSTDKDYIVTEHGKEWFANYDVYTDELRLKNRMFAYKCLDWSERKYHIAGALGASILNIMLKNDWIRKIKNSREILVTSKGNTAFKELLDFQL